MTFLSILTFIKDIDPISAVLLILILLISIWQGWITVQGINIKKKAKAVTPLQCLYGRAGACTLTRLQMEYAESAISEMKANSYSGYLKIRKEKLGGKAELAKDRDAHHYNAVLYQVWDYVKDMMRYFFRENHLADMTPSEFELHAQKRVDTIMTSLTERLTLLYYPDSNPDRIELYDYNMQYIVPSIKIMLKDIFVEGRKLALQFVDGSLDKHMERKV